VDRPTTVAVARQSSSSTVGPTLAGYFCEVEKLVRQCWLWDQLRELHFLSLDEPTRGQSTRAISIQRDSFDGVFLTSSEVSSLGSCSSVLSSSSQSTVSIDVELSDVCEEDRLDRVEEGLLCEAEGS
jgi:hypothetical protein